MSNLANICGLVLWPVAKRCQDTQHNDIQHNGTRHNDIQRDDTQHNDIQRDDIQHKELISDIQHYDTQYNNIAIMLNVIVLSVAFYLLLC